MHPAAIWRKSVEDHFFFLKGNFPEVSQHTFIYFSLDGTFHVSTTNWRGVWEMESFSWVALCLVKTESVFIKEKEEKEGNWWTLP